MAGCGFETPLVHADKCNDYIAKSHTASQKQNYAEAEKLLQSAGEEAVKSKDALLPPTVMTELAEVKRDQKRYKDAEDLLRKALVLYRSMSNTKLNQDQREDLARDRIATMMKIADVCLEEGKPEEAAPIYNEALADSQKSVGNLYAQHKLVQHYAEMLRKTGREEDAEQAEAEYQALDPDQNLHLSWLATVSALRDGTPEDAEKHLRIIAVAGRQLGEPMVQLTAMKWLVQCEKWRGRQEHADQYAKKTQSLEKTEKMKIPARIDEDQLALAWAIDDPPTPLVLEAIKHASAKEFSEILGRVADAYQKHGDAKQANRTRKEANRIHALVMQHNASVTRAPNSGDWRLLKDEIKDAVPRN
jgi:tetratricopeptide (TPR) repeat protein